MLTLDLPNMMTVMVISLNTRKYDNIVVQNVLPLSVLSKCLTVFRRSGVASGVTATREFAINCFPRVLDSNGLYHRAV
jgi:hypothetical protein